MCWADSGPEVGGLSQPASGLDSSRLVRLGNQFSGPERRSVICRLEFSHCRARQRAQPRLRAWTNRPVEKKSLGRCGVDWKDGQRDMRVGGAVGESEPFILGNFPTGHEPFLAAPFFQPAGLRF